MASSELRNVKFDIIGNGSDFDLIKTNKYVNLKKGIY